MPVGWGTAVLAGLSNAVLLQAASLPGPAPSLQVVCVSVPRVLVLGPPRKGQQLPRRRSYSVDGRDTRGSVSAQAHFEPLLVLPTHLPKHVTWPSPGWDEKVHFVSLD